MLAIILLDFKKKEKDESLWPHTLLLVFQLGLVPLYESSVRASYFCWIVWYS